MKKTLSALFVLATALSCKVQIVEEQELGSISVSLDNATVVEVLTKAGEEVSVDNFTVNITSADQANKYTYVKSELPSVLSVPAGWYTVSAENITEASSLSQPDSWGQIRYAGTSESKEVKVGQTTSYAFTCTVANTAVSVVFKESIAEYFTNYKVDAFTVEGRTLTYTAANTTGETPVVGFFSPGTLTYTFSGTFTDGKPRSIQGTKTLTAATHQHLTFKVTEQEGSIGITIDVDATCTDMYETITVDPTQGLSSM